MNYVAMKSRRTVHRSEPAAAPGRRRIGFGTHAAFTGYYGGKDHCVPTVLNTNLPGVVVRQGFS